MPAFRSLTNLSFHGCATFALLIAPGAAIAADAASTPLLSYDLTVVVPQPIAAPIETEASLDPAAVECMAKVVHHESRGQPRKGQIAVARTLVNRMHAGSRFGETICAVANQPGQYFNTRAYHPARDDDWQEAVDVARDTLDGSAEDVAPGALYFHAAYRPTSGFFRSRQRIAAIGDQVFYR